MELTLADFGIDLFNATTIATVAWLFTVFAAGSMIGWAYQWDDERVPERIWLAARIFCYVLWIAVFVIVF